MKDPHEESVATCPQCGAALGQGDRFCRGCGLELDGDQEKLFALIERIVPDRVDAALKVRLKEQKVVEIETAELLAERAVKWLKILGFLLGIPVILVVSTI